MILRERQLFLSTSATLFVFYILSILAGTIKLRSYLRQESADPFYDITFLISYSLLFIALGASLYTPEAVILASQERSTNLHASAISRLTYWWISPLLRRARDRFIRTRDLFDAPVEPAGNISAHFDDIQRDLQADGDTSLRAALSRLTGRMRYRQIASSLVAVIVAPLGPFCLYNLVRNVEDGWDAPEFVGMFVLGLMMAPLIVSMAEQYYMHLAAEIGMTLRAAVVNAVYRKVTRLPVATVADIGVDGVMPLVSLDAERVRELPLFIHRAWSAPLQIVVAIAFLVEIFGWPALAGLAYVNLRGI